MVARPSESENETSAKSAKKTTIPRRVDKASVVFGQMRLHRVPPTDGWYTCIIYYSTVAVSVDTSSQPDSRPANNHDLKRTI